MHGGRFPKPRRFASAALLVAFVATGALGGFFSSAKPANAWAISVPITDTATGYLASKEGADTVKEGILTAAVNTAAIAFLNMSRYALQRIAYDAANYVASGDWGQKPLFLTEGFDSYIENVGKDALGEAIGTISQEGGFEKLGINLCSPPDPKIALNIKLGFLNGLPGQLGGPLGPGQPKPKCDFNQIVSNWDSFVSQDSDELLDNVGVMFTPGQSTLDVALQFQGYSRDILSKSQVNAINKYVGDKGFKPVTAKIAQWTLTPAEVVRSEQERARKEAGEKETSQATMITGAAFSKGLVYGVLGAAAATFASTLGEKLMKKIFEKGLITLSQAKVEHINILGLFQGGGGGGGRAGAELANADLLTVRLKAVPNFSELVDFATCPDGFRNINNCVIDQAFYTAVSRADEGTAITLRQAVDQGFVRGNFRLLPLSHPKNTDRNCYLEAFCYSNLAKLRKARIIPIGWELAANSPQNDPSRPITLREVMDRFNDCPVDAQGNVDESKLPDPLHPWCHLINPEWILTYPTAVCRQQAPGPLLLSAQSDQRSQTCVDVVSCISKDAAGNCVGGYGYCMREKSYWKLDADACPAYYASCQAVEKRAGGTAAYLLNTAETGICGAENAGCLSYSTVANAVPNASFEDVLLVGGAPRPRDWSYGAGVRFDSTSLKSVAGRAALGVNSANTATAVARVPADAELKLSASALRELSGTGALGRVSVQFHDRLGTDVSQACAKTTSGGLPKPCVTDDDCSSGDTCQAVVIETTCVQGGPGRVTLEVPANSFGHSDAACDVRVPKNAASATLTLSASVGAADRVWFDQVALTGAAFSASPADLRFVDDQAKACSGDQAGCTSLFPQRRTSPNLIPNPGFERVAGDNLPLDWTIGSLAAYGRDAVGSFEGAGYVNLAAAGIVNQTIEDLLPEATYSFSLHVKSGDPGATETGQAVLRLRDASGNGVAPIESSCDLVGDEMRLPYQAGEEFTRPDCSFTTPAEGYAIDIEMTPDAGSGTTFLDAVQFELSVLPTPYHDGIGGATPINMKVAPEGLGCTGGASDPIECGRYAKACLRREVGCTMYTPQALGVSVPAIAGPGDACPAICSGYATFRQEPTNFVDEKFPQFFIPQTGRACTAAEAGCEEFTNVEELARGGEARQAFTYLRACFLPDDRTTTYYTWEGSDARGYQLRAWSLMRSDVTSTATGLGGSDPTGGVGPCTTIRYDSLGRPQCADGSAAATAVCTKIEMRFNPDCREYFDVDGNIHYRRHSKTVLSTAGCREFRMTKSDRANCESHGGLWRNEECHHFAYAPESQSCRREAAGCRAYNGAAARNVRIALDEGFETLTTSGWTDVPGADPTSDVVNSSESVAQGGHSLKSAARAIHKDVSDTVRRNRQYLLTFWAKGSGGLRVRFSQAGDVPFTFNRATSSTSEVGMTGEWNAYTVGPVLTVATPIFDAADPATNERLIFENDAASDVTPFFVDNVQLREVASSIYLIEDSWRTPAVCDQDAVGNAAPQYMLGCQTYTDQRGAVSHLKSFSGICRPEAVGCDAFYDTRNTASLFATSHKAVCTLTDGAGAPKTCVPTGGSVTCPCEAEVRGVEREVCQVIRGSVDCRYDADDDAGRALSDDDAASGHISPDGDTARNAKDGLVYLIDEPSKRCDADQLGCKAFGTPVHNQDGDAIVGWSETFKIDHERDYASALCTKPEEFCQAYKRVEDGAPLYFKEPGKHLCEFRSNVTVEGIAVSGWFKKGLDEPCYPTYLQAGNFYGIWKNADPDYERWVGECQPDFSMCKEFIDTADTSEDQPKGQPYYAIMNDRLDVTSCGGRVSLQRSPQSANEASACVLFRRTDDFSLTYNATATYAVSEASGGALVEPIVNAGNDANVIIRVERDRRCAEWLDCRSSEKVWNQAGGSFQNVCTSLGLCTEYQQVGDVTRCVRFSDSEVSGLVLDPKTYQGREAGAKDRDFSGYSVPYRYPAQELTTVDVSNDGENPDPRLVYSIGPCSVAYGAECGNPNNRGYRGSCLGPPSHRQCVYAIDGSRPVTDRSQLLQSSGLQRYPGVACRAYPQETSPFPATVADPAGWDMLGAEVNGGSPVLVSPASNFAGANVCQRRMVNGVEFSSCECNYQIGTYGGTRTRRFFDIEDPGVPAGYCEGGTYDRYECDPRASGVRTASNLTCCSRVLDDGGSGFSPFPTSVECSDGAVCGAINKLERVIGYEGQCLERDLSTPINNRSDEFACLTWRPVTFVGGGRDIYNLHQTAGYFAPPGRRFYCVGSMSEPVDSGDLSKGYKGYSFKVNISPVDVTTDFITGEDGKRMFVPPFQPITKLFGPGKVNNAIPNFQSGTKGSRVGDSDQDNHGGTGVNCANVNDPEHQGGWCVYPGLSKLNITKAAEGDDSSDDNEEIPNGYRLSGDAIGPLGCYEVADEGSAQETYIDFPYIGPPIYKDQLLSIDFDLKSGLNRGESIATNPNQDVSMDCSDEIEGNDHGLCGGSGTPGCTNSFRYVGFDGDADSMVDSPVFTSDFEGDDPTGISRPVPPDGDGTCYHCRKAIARLDHENKFLADVAKTGRGNLVFRADFDAYGRFVNLHIAAADNEGGKEEATFAIRGMSFTYKPGCESVAMVDEPGEFGLTKAYTDRVNVYRDFDRNGPYEVSDPVQACSPWGAIGIASSPSQTPWTYVAVHEEYDAESKRIIHQCTTESFRAGSFYDSYDEASFGAADPDEDDPYGGSSFGRVLQRIFRKVFGLWDYKKLTEPAGPGDDFKQQDLYKPASKSRLEDLDLTDEDPPELDFLYGNVPPPRVASVDTARCEGGVCPVGRVGYITVNGRERGVIQGQNGSIVSTAEFFAWASHNAMPIRSRIMYWGDTASKEPPATGWYKNQKPFCSSGSQDEGAVNECRGFSGLTCRTSADCPGGVSCDTYDKYCSGDDPATECRESRDDSSCSPDSCVTDADCGTRTCISENHFGNTPGACTEAPYRFEHVYTCGKEDLAKLKGRTCAEDANELVTNAPCLRVVAGTPTCVYRPAAQVIDNWGWCNCTGTGCETSGGNHGDKCAPGSGSGEPWTAFEGEVRVTPRAEDLVGFTLLPNYGGDLFGEIYSAQQGYYKLFTRGFSGVFTDAVFEDLEVFAP